MNAINFQSFRIRYLTLLTVCFFIFLFHMYVYFRFPLVYGVDGPYYLIQIKSILSTGSMKYGDPPLIFYIMSFFSLFLEPTVAVKIVMSLFASLTPIPITMLFWRSSKEWYTGLASSIFLCLNIYYLRMTSDLMKNAAGILFLLSSLYFLILLFREIKLSYTLSLLLFSIFTGLTHILDFGVLIYYVSLMSLFALFRRRDVLVRSLLPVLLMLSAFILSAVILLPGFMGDLMKGVAFLEDVVNMEGISDFRPLKRPIHLLIFPYILIGLSIVAIFLLYHKDRELRPLSFLLVINIVLISILTFPLLPREWFWRFVLMSVLPQALAVGLILHAIPQRILRVLFFISCLIFLSYTLEGGIRGIRPTILPAEYEDLIVISRIVPPDSHIQSINLPPYWIEYLMNGSWRFHPPKVDTYYVVRESPRKGLPPFLRHLSPIYVGKRLKLYYLPPKK